MTWQSSVTTRAPDAVHGDAGRSGSQLPLRRVAARRRQSRHAPRGCLGAGAARRAARAAAGVQPGRRVASQRRQRGAAAGSLCWPHGGHCFACHRAGRAGAPLPRCASAPARPGTPPARSRGVQRLALYRLTRRPLPTWLLLGCGLDALFAAAAHHLCGSAHQRRGAALTRRAGPPAARGGAP